jgi:hypothetical protein
MVTGKLEAPINPIAPKLLGALGGLFLPQPFAPIWFLPEARANWRHPSQYLFDRTLSKDVDQRNRLSPTTSIARLVECPSTLLRRVNSMDKPNGRLVLVSYTHYCAFTSSLSTRWSSWALQGDLILGRASRLYAFSGYHNRTSLPSRAIGMTTGTQEVRPSRSSRTKDSPPQISYAHSR